MERDSVLTNAGPEDNKKINYFYQKRALVIGGNGSIGRACAI